MAEYEFRTVDVFTDRRFGGNPLAVLIDARGLSDAAMQAIAREFNLSETTFVLPPRDPAHAAHVRIFTPGRPSCRSPATRMSAPRWCWRTLMPTRPEKLVFEEAAGLVPIRFDWSGAPQATLDAPHAADARRRAAGIGRRRPAPGCAKTRWSPASHPPVIAGVGTDFVIAEVTAEGLRDASARYRRDARGGRSASRSGRSASRCIYMCGRGRLCAPACSRPLSGIPEDPATGSANVALAALLARTGRGGGARTDYSSRR